MALKICECWSLLIFLFLPFCLCQEEYSEVSVKDIANLTKVVENPEASRYLKSEQTEAANHIGGVNSRQAAADKTGKVQKKPKRNKFETKVIEQPTSKEQHEIVDRPAHFECNRCCHRAEPGPRGWPGPPGQAGIPGNHGNNGNNGLPGHEGEKGEQGPKGDMGPRGERGIQGIKGEKGQAGIPSELKVAFMASMATHFTNQNSGIIFSSVETNVGSYFDVMTGRFTAPITGVYFFIFNMMKHEDVEETSVYLMHNGNVVISMYSSESKGKHDTSGNSGVLKLQTGDEVWLRMGNGALHGDHQRHCTFSGFLLFEGS
ncbi:complement C1q tumor necrosis factor-related protein 3-like isoform X1 [Stegostoma tigrinum]|uniref:complement C1q tumor necrosis factor-related protein 3-like isoform X1 n=1 Tax=Stegostoma tigrinum TaxID=3053191 RepID=UPI00202B702C|nr:complement C1q tumor necrosis factor-related protein 3-like isoform X1 [Stegostoma tigrinum]